MQLSFTPVSYCLMCAVYIWPHHKLNLSPQYNIISDCNEEMKTTLSSLESRLDEAERRMERAIDLNSGLLHCTNSCTLTAYLLLTFCILTSTLLLLNSESEDNEDSNVLAGMRILRQEGVTKVLRQCRDLNNAPRIF